MAVGNTRAIGALGFGLLIVTILFEVFDRSSVIKTKKELIGNKEEVST